MAVIISQCQGREQHMRAAFEAGSGDEGISKAVVASHPFLEHGGHDSERVQGRTPRGCPSESASQGALMKAPLNRTLYHGLTVIFSPGSTTLIV